MTNGGEQRRQVAHRYEASPPVEVLVQPDTVYLINSVSAKKLTQANQ